MEPLKSQHQAGFLEGDQCVLVEMQGEIPRMNPNVLLTNKNSMTIRIPLVVFKSLFEDESYECLT